MSAERWVVLEPLDTVVVRDGRAFDAGVQSVARTGPPTPGTVAGAIGAAYQAPPGAGLDPAARGRDLPERLLGPIPVVRREGAWSARWPVPRDVVGDDNHSAPYRLTVGSAHPGTGHMPAGVQHDLGGSVAALPGGFGDPLGGWWETDELAGYLAGGTASGDTVSAPWEVERRVGLAIDENGTAAEGMLYSAEHLRPAEGMGFAVCCIGGPEIELLPTVPLGGRGRCAQVHDAEPAPALPGPAASARDGQLLVYLAAPAVFGDGWRPDLSAWPGTELVTAVLGDPQVIATATPQRRTGAVGGGRLMWAVPAGSVYYLKFADERAALDAAEHLRRVTLPQARDSLATAGFGFALTGSW